MLLSILLACGLGIVALTFVLVPLFSFLPTKTAQIVPQENTSGVNEVQEREQSARSALQEIELDYQLGNIAQEDYNILRERHMRHALFALKSRYDSGQDISDGAEAYEGDKEFDDLIEARLRELKEQDARD